MNNNLQKSLMRYENMNEILNKRIPEVLDMVEAVKNDFGKDESPYIYYAETICILLKRLLIQGVDKEAKILLQNIFFFIEEMASSDQAIQELVQVCILESLWESSIILKNAEKIMFVETKKLNQNISAYLIHPDKVEQNTYLQTERNMAKNRWKYKD